MNFKTLVKVSYELISQIYDSLIMIRTFLWSSQSVGLHDLARSPFFLFSLFQTLGIITFNLSTRGGPFHPFHPNYTFYFKTSRENIKNNDGKGYQGHFRSAKVTSGRWYYSKILVMTTRENNLCQFCQTHHKIYCAISVTGC